MSLILKFPAHILGFLNWWLGVMPTRIFRSFEEIFTKFDGSLQLVSNLRLWFMFEPLFGDYGWKGRMIGFLFRGVRAAVTVLIYISILIVAAAFELGWILLLPASIGLIFGLI